MKNKHKIVSNKNYIIKVMKTMYKQFQGNFPHLGKLSHISLTGAAVPVINQN